jgi:nifR3 family TIM-barrel protein
MPKEPSPTDTRSEDPQRLGRDVGAECNRHVPPAGPDEFAPLCLGPLKVWPPVVLAPMAGVTNLAFRRLCKDYGAGICTSEMITARGYRMGNAMTHLLAAGGHGESPRSVQVYGSDPLDVGEMVAALVADGVDHVDLNFGCPVPKVTRLGGGSAIPVKARLLARLVRAAVGSAGEVPVTVKVRKGIDEQLITYRDAGRVAEEEGAAAICLHGRTAAQLYSGEADWEAIADLKASVAIPVLGNGDIWEAWDALRMMRSTGCDGVVVGRACLGRPWLFGELAAIFEGREPDPPPVFGVIAEIMHDHALALVELFGPERGVWQMRKWCSWYTKGFRGSASIRGRLARMASLEEMQRVLAEIDPATPFPLHVLRVNRAKRSGTQRVRLPEGYLEDRDDDTPPRSPHTPDELEAWERALSGG